MFVILIERGGIKNIINIVYGRDKEISEDWVYNYLMKQIEMMESMSFKNTIGYKIEDIGNDEYILLKEYKDVIKGYIYNSYEKKAETLLKVSILEYTDSQPNKKKFLQQYHKMLVEKQRVQQTIKEKRE